MVVVVLAFSSRARIMGEGAMNQSPPALFVCLFVFCLFAFCLFVFG